MTQHDFSTEFIRPESAAIGSLSWTVQESPKNWNFELSSSRTERGRERPIGNEWPFLDPLFRFNFVPLFILSDRPLVRQCPRFPYSRTLLFVQLFLENGK